MALLAAATRVVPGPVVEDVGRLGRGPGLPAARPAPGVQPGLVLGGRLAAAALGFELLPAELPVLLVGERGGAGHRWAGTRRVRTVLAPAEIVLRLPVGLVALYRDGIRQPLPWLPVTSPARTVQDAAADLDDLQLLWLMEQALAKGEPDLVRGASRRLKARLVPLLGKAEPQSRSPLETAVRLLLVGAGLPVPQSNVRVLPGIVCDLVWASAHLVVECDGLAWHSGASVVSRDAVRHRTLQRGGWTVLRVTWDDLRQRPDELVADIRSILDR